MKMINQKTKIPKAKIRKILKEKYLNKFIITIHNNTNFIINILYPYKIYNNKIMYCFYEYNNGKLNYIHISLWRLIDECTLNMFEKHCQKDLSTRCHII